MSYPSKVIDYAPEKMRAFHAYGYEHIDCRQFALAPEAVLGMREQALPYIDEASRHFYALGWQGDGEVELLWLPPFVFPLSMRVPTQGIVIWHVKQERDGVSFLVSPIPLPFEEFA
ncbi:hypothetical protein BZG29_15815 [Janthinobacterium sp. LM6]|uniref:hypothetical protein n=1 Tax=Janthinobacterium sp. LM6 TaxID=1938606 RepID=UPI000983DFC3|nr:hypothetical protein [Janthinobacterium sp. LM6]AQR69632.1 hypothetical protein BZG29_15815 [Janthinobacterium sp. LM6]